LKIIPVIDVLNAVAVHAVRGKREEYQPLKSVLTASINPVEVATVFKTQGFSTLYLADLDAILGKKPNLALFSSIAEHTGLNLMVDAGITDIQTAKTLQKNNISKVIIGTETLQNKNFVKQAITQLGADQVTVSLDMKNGKVLTQPNFDGPTDVHELLGEFKALGVSEVILLDLARVGSGEGVNMDFLKQALAVFGDGVYVGGGVRNFEDLLELKALGISGALLATALHTGKISVESLRQARLL
jgi:phosphoribosylformimino-5-aminoimidazole carboxamide ribotide isomerase